MKNSSFKEIEKIISKAKKILVVTHQGPDSDAVGSLAAFGFYLKKIKKETVIFKGKALDAIKNFPQNINVAGLLSIAGLGIRNTLVKIITSPEYKVNSHEVQIESKAGKIKTVCENVAFKENPKTSYLAALSAMAVLKNMFEPVRMGN